MCIVTVAVLFVCWLSPALSFSIHMEHIFTICNGTSVIHTQGGDVIPPCDHLPLAGSDFFKSVANNHNISVDGCHENRTSSGDAIERNLATLKRGVDILRERLLRLVDILRRQLLMQSTPLGDIITLWNWGAYFAICSVVSALFFLGNLFDVSVTSYLTSIILGIGTGSLYYSIHLFYGDNRLLLVYMFIGLMSASPLYSSCRLRFVSFVAWLQLLFPLSALWVYNVFETRLFFGPVLSCVLNGVLMLLHLLCLVLLYIDERLTAVKVILMPLYRISQDAVTGNQAALAFFEPVHRRASRLVIGLLETLNETVDNQNSYQLDDQMDYQLGSLLSKKLEQLCRNSAEVWAAQCPSLLHRSCSTYFRYQPIGLLDTFTNQFGAMFEAIPGLGNPLGRPVTQTSPRCDLCEKICGMIVRASCGSVDFSEHCRPEAYVTRFMEAYRSLMSSLQYLHSSLDTRSTPPILTNFFGESDPQNFVHATIYEDIILVFRHGVGFLASFFGTVVVLYAVMSSYRFLRNYRDDPLFFKVYINAKKNQNWTIILSENERKRYTQTWTDIIGSQMKMFLTDQSLLKDAVQLLFQVTIAFCVEQIGRLVHQQVHQLLNFSVPTYGDASFAFRVQGNGTVAAVIGSVLTGFNVHTQYCDIATTDACMTPFISVGWSTWTVLWLTALIYFAACFFTHRSAHCISLDSIWMAIICDRLLPYQSDRRDAALLQQIRQDRRKRGIIIQQLTREALATVHPRLSDKDDTVTNYVRRSLPNRIANWWKIGRIDCEICYLDVAVACFPCRSLLFCQECSHYLVKCPSHYRI